VWAFVVFLINGLVFILIGLQLRSVREGLEGRTTAELVSTGRAGRLDEGDGVIWCWVIGAVGKSSVISSPFSVHPPSVATPP
jgi:NhaP-type Na+/H+ or K+/H+ antiporter